MFRKYIVICFMLFTAGVFTIQPSFAQDSRSLATDVYVKPGKVAVGRLKNIPDDVEVTLGVSSDAGIWVYLIDEEGYKLFPKVKNPLLVTRVSSVLNLTMRIEKGGNHYILFQNRNVSNGVKVNFFTRVTK